MIGTYDTYCRLKKEAFHGEWAVRILSEIGYLYAVSAQENGAYDEKIHEQAAFLAAYFKENGAITKEAAMQAENALLFLREKAKQYTVTCAAHAHIDMNWMWGFQETASLTVDTFRTMLQLMDEYPDFHFSQSQASTYAIIEDYYPELLQKIRARVQEGRWELTTSSWVENDKNMSGPEAMARHLLYTKRYMSTLMGVDIDSLELDFEPDTFGHNENMPEILQQGGVKYYYHCRGYDGEYIYNWRAPSGAQVLVYREPNWYNTTIEYDMFENVPSFCGRYGIYDKLCVYGVGDHGGGPTRRDLKRLHELAAMPLMPTIQFGSMRGFFKKLDAQREQFPVVEQELNYVFTGCYTSQSRIKRANRMGEERLYDSEMTDALAAFMDKEYHTPSAFVGPWRKVLFNQFHDILPGSGVPETRQYALGLFQQAMAAANINMNGAMNALCAQIDTSAAGECNAEDMAMGAGVGYGVNDETNFGFTRTERGHGCRRVYTVFNTTEYARTAPVEIMLWDFVNGVDTLQVTDFTGKEIPFTVMESGTHYWGHHYDKILILATVPAFGYASYIFQSKLAVFSAQNDPNPRTDETTDAPIVLENAKVRAVLDASSGKLISFTEKATGKQLIGKDGAGLLYIEEQNAQEMTAWRVGRYGKVVDLQKDCKVEITAVQTKGLRPYVDFFFTYSASRIDVRVSLDENDETLRFAVKVDWHEIGRPGQCIPQLNFAAPLAFTAETSRCAVQFGTIDRPADARDVPCIGAMSALPADGSAQTLAILSDCKYGFRLNENTLSCDLLRSSYDPDLYPENGIQYMNIGLRPTAKCKKQLLRAAKEFAHPLIVCSNAIHGGKLATSGKLFSFTGEVNVCAVKQGEEGGTVVRLYNPTCQPVSSTLTFAAALAGAATCDVVETKFAALPADGAAVTVEIPAHAVRTVKVW